MTKHQSEPNAQPASESCTYEHRSPPGFCTKCGWTSDSFPNPEFFFDKSPASEASGREESLNSLEARLAADIRAIDGNHDKGAAELAEQLIARGWHPAAPAGEREDDVAKLRRENERLTDKIFLMYSAAGPIDGGDELKAVEHLAEMARSRRVENERLRKRIAELRSQLDTAQKEVDRLDWLVKRETGTWLETRDANQRLTEDATAARQQAAIVLNSMEWDGDGYCWTGGQWDYRLTPSEAVELTASKIKNLEASHAALQAKLDAVAGLEEKWRKMHSYWWADELAAALAE
jgi:hypothetical protein